MLKLKDLIPINEAIIKWKDIPKSGTIDFGKYRKRKGLSISDTPSFPFDQVK